MPTALAFVLGAAFGAAVALAAGYLRARAGRATEGHLRDAFASLSADALAVNSQQFLTLAREALAGQATAGVAELDKRKGLIDQSLQQVTSHLENLRALVGQLENARRQDYGQLGQRVAEVLRQTADLRQTTESLRAALAHPQRRGQWGERMADDILQLAGMIEGVSYVKQQTLAGSGRRPDFTFLLPNDIRLHMDVKFPMDNYLRCVQADGDDGRAQAADAFRADVLTQVRGLATRDYIDPAGGTADFVLMFIPNEQMFAFIQELDPALLREASRRRVLLVGPLSLLAVLAIVRQAAEAANLSRQTDQALDLIGEFARQWDRFKTELDRLGQRIDQVQRQFEAVRTTRVNMLERPLTRLEQLRSQTTGEEPLAEPVQTPAPD